MTDSGAPPARSTEAHPALVISAIALLFLAVRLALFYVRQPFFDELFTIWIAKRGFAGIIDALRHDSGPPLYYFVVRALSVGTVDGARFVSLACAGVSAAVLLTRRELGNARFTAASILALFAPAVLFSVDGRAYAMCAMFITIAIALVDDGRSFAAALALVLAAYAHYYGVLFFPILLMPAAGTRRPAIGVRIAAGALAGLLFVPGFLLASHQPREATAWITGIEWPDALFVRPSLLVIAVGGVAVIAAGAMVNRYTTMLLIPYVAAGVIALSGRAVYTPLRFESVIAPALSLAIAASLQRNRPALRRIFGALVLLSFAVFTYDGIVEHARRAADPYRAAASWAARNVPAKVRVVATGFLYLESVSARPAPVEAWPEEQAEHPGWRAHISSTERFPSPPFVWIGEGGSREASLLRRRFTFEPLYVNGQAVVARVSGGIDVRGLAAR